MPSDRIRQNEMTGDLGPDYLKGRRGAAGSDLAGQGYGNQGFGGDPEEGPRRSRLLPLVIAFFALAAFAGIVWYAYEWGVGEVEPEHLPVVQAPSGPIKEKPAEPGGLEVPYTDSTVLNRTEGDTGGNRVESLLPPPEEPVEVPPAPVEVQAPEPPGEPVPETAADAPAAQDDPSGLPDLPQPAESETSASEERATEQPDPSETPLAEQQVAEQPVVAPEPVAEAPAETSVTAEEAPAQPEPAATPEAARPETAPSETVTAETATSETATSEAATPPAESPEAAPAPAPAAGPVEPGSWVIQLAALRQEAAARQEWSRIQRANEALLGAMPLQLERADLGAQGVYYRIQTGPLPNRATARDLCAQLKAAGQDCIAKQR